MLFITPSANVQGAKDYFTRELSRSDYYLRDAQEMAGQWHGLGAELLGLSGQVEQRQFFRLCDNQHPLTGRQLTPCTKADRRVLYDFTFDAPKSVSLAFELGGDERVLDAFRTSVRETMGEMEADMMARVRAGGADTDRRTANMVWAEFVHRTARPVDGVPDPQLHCHAVAFNATYDSEESRWKAGQFANLVRDKGYYQAAFHSRLAGHLDALGYGIERDGNSFALTGVSRTLTDKFSRRTLQVEAEAERLGITDPKAKGELGRRTREAKDHGGSITALRAQWLARLTDAERESLAQARHAATRTDSATTAIDFAIAHSFERASVVPEKKLVAEALMQGVGTTTVAEAWQAVRRDGVIRHDRDGQRLVTTREVYREEAAMLHFAREGRGLHRRLGGAQVHGLEPGLSQEQREAALAILNSRDTVTGLSGGAGTGKTRMMQATVRAIEDNGTRVYTFAPSAKAARGVLRSEGFAAADTVEKLLTDTQLRREIRGQLLWIDEAGLLSSRDMKRVFDLASAEQCRVVLSGDVNQHSAVGRGDALRLLERDAGMKVARLTEIRRQTNDDYRAAVRALAAGDAPAKDGRTQLEHGFALLDRMGAVVQAEGEERHRRLAADYAEATAVRGRLGKAKTALVVSPTHAESERVAEAIRATLKREGRLQGKERSFVALKALSLTEAQRGRAASYRAGDVVRFHQNATGFTRGERVTVTASEDASALRVARADGSMEVLPLRHAAKFQVYQTEALTLAAGDRLRITQNGYSREATRGGKKAKTRLSNGDIFDVAGFTRAGDIRLSNGAVLPKDYGGIAQGYVVTSHASQGSTVDRVLIALGTESLAAANRQQFYVSASRGREAVRLYTDDKAAVMQAVKADASRLSATELLEGPVKPRKRPQDSPRRLAGLQQVQRAYDAVRERVAAFADRALAQVWDHEPRRKEMHLGH